MTLPQKITDDAELHLRFFENLPFKDGPPLGEARILVKDIQSKPNTLLKFPITGGEGRYVLVMAGPLVAEIVKDHLERFLAQASNTSYSELMARWAAAGEYFAQTGEAASYSATMLTFLIAGATSPTGLRDWFSFQSLDENGADTYVFKGPRADNCTSYAGHEDCVRLLSELAPKFGTNNFDSSAYRLNGLGFLLYNFDDMWPELGTEARIALTHNQENHALCRKYLARALGPEGEGRWKAADIKAAATAFWTGRRTLTATQDLDVWTTQVLHKIHLGLEIDWEDGVKFMDMQSKILMGTAVGKDFPTIGAALVQKAERHLRYKQAFQQVFPGEQLTAAQLTLVTSAFMDSLFFAGGVSIPYVLGLAFGLPYSSWGQENLPRNFVLRKSTLKSYVLEIIRRFPPVTGVGWVEKGSSPKEPDQLIYANLMMAMRDPRVWGENPDEFRLRPLSDYHKLSVAFAEPAIAGSNGAPNSHVCPAKDLAFVMLFEFITAFLVEVLGKDAFEADQAFDVSTWEASSQPSISEYGAGSFGLARK